MTDAIVIGSGPNELVLASYLAKAGQKVTLIEKPSPYALQPIGSAKGYQAPVREMGWVSPKVVRDLKLGFEATWPEINIASPELTLHSDLGKQRAAIAKLSERDAGQWDQFCARMETLAGFLETLYAEEPPRLMSGQAGDLFSLMAVGLRLRRLGKVDMIELLRTLPMSVQDLLDDSFDSNELKALVGGAGVTNILQGPRSAGTCFVMLHHLVGRKIGGFRARPQQGDVMGALKAAAQKLGVTLLPNRPCKLVLENGRAVGVQTNEGTLSAKIVVSGLDPRATFFDLVDPTELEPEFVKSARHVKLRGIRAVVNLALASKPTFKGIPAEATTFAFGAPHLDMIERAYDDAKHGGVSRNLVLEASLSENEGKHVLSVAVQYVPHRANASELGDRVVAALKEHASSLDVIDRAVWSPADLEKQFGLTEGHLDQGELTLDQILFMRPVPGFGHYRTPIENLFMCGDACHPGGGMPGLAGANAAREIGREL